MRVLVAGGVFRLSPEERQDRQPAPEQTLVEGLRAAGIDAVAVPLEERWFIARARQFDVVHVHHLSRAAVMAALSPAARPFVFTEHQSGRATSRVHRAAQRLVLARATAVVCLSQSEARTKTRDYGSFGSRLHVIPNGIELPAETLQERSWQANQPFTVLYVGQLIDWKQIDRAILALPHLPDNVRMRLVFHNDLLLDDLRALTRSVGVESRVEFVGQRSGKDLIDEYLAAHVLVLPSGTPEALPSVVTESLQTGLPVIGSDVGAVAEQVREAGVIVSPDGNDLVTGAVATVMGDYPRFASTAYARGIEVRHDYTIRQMVDRHVRLYNDVTSP